MSTWFSLSLLVFFTLTPSVRADEGAVQLDVSRIGGALHLEFSGTKDWKYDLKAASEDETKVVLRLGGLKGETIQKLRRQKDGLIQAVSVQENGIDGKTEITFKITNKTDFFDYLTDQPSKLIIDFFPKEVTSVQATAKKSPPTEDDEESAVVNPTKTLPAKTQKRKPASGDFVLVAKNQIPPPTKPASTKVDVPHGIFDGGDPDFSRFSIHDYEIRPEAIKESRANFYLDFPMLDLGAPQLRTLIMTPPTYEIVAGEGRENQEARVVLKLFEENKTALLLKTAEEFMQSYPESRYTEIMRYLVADTHYKIWRSEKSFDDFETAMNQYLKLVEKYPRSPITPRTLLLIGYSYLTRGDAFAALKSFQHFARVSPESKQLDRVNISSASAYLALNRFDDAFAILDQVEKNGKTQKGKEEAAYRKGDVYFRQKNYPKAVAEYEGAWKRFPAASGRFPNAGYNVAEAQFATEKYRESLESYGKFLKNFPDHDHGGFAMTRMGELLGILGADSKRAEGAFLESYFRYRATPGAGVARIRMLASRLPSMKEKELSSAIQEMTEISRRYENRPLSAKEKKKLEEAQLVQAKKEQEKASAHGGGGGHGGGEGAVAHGEEKKEEGFKVAADPDEDATRKLPELPGIEEFTTLLLADGYTARDEFETASQSLISYFQKNPNSINKERILGRIQKNMTENIHAAIERGDFIEALRQYSRESGAWLKNSGRLDLPVYVGRAYEHAGVFKEAGEIYAQDLKSLEARKPESPLPIRELTPRPESLHLRLASVAAREKNLASAESHLKRIKETARLSEPEQIEYAEVAADVNEARGQSQTAKKYLSDLIKSWKGDPRLTASLHLRIARIDSKQKDYKDADQHLAKIAEFKAGGEYMPEDVHPQALELQGDIAVARGQRTEATKFYRELLTDYEDKRPLSSIRYRLGQILFEDGNLKGAEAAWSELKPDRDGVWFRLAGEQMQGAKWQKEYRKYIDRIPAASPMRASR